MMVAPQTRECVNLPVALFASWRVQTRFFSSSARTVRIIFLTLAIKVPSRAVRFLSLSFSRAVRFYSAFFFRTAASLTGSRSSFARFRACRSWFVRGSAPRHLLPAFFFFFPFFVFIKDYNDDCQKSADFDHI